MKKNLFTVISIYLLPGLLAVSTAFGIIKQIKTALKSKSEYSGIQTEPGYKYRFLKQVLLSENKSQKSVAYYIGRDLVGQDRHRGDLFYNCQYEFLPIILTPYEIGRPFPEEEYIVLDMPDEQAVLNISKSQNLQILTQQGRLALAKRQL